MSQLWPVWSDDQGPEKSPLPSASTGHENYSITLERTAGWVAILKAERWSQVWIQNIQFSFSFRYYNARFSARQYTWGWLSGEKKKKTILREKTIRNWHSINLHHPSRMARSLPNNLAVSSCPTPLPDITSSFILFDLKKNRQPGNHTSEESL